MVSHFCFRLLVSRLPFFFCLLSLAQRAVTRKPRAQPWETATSQNDQAQRAATRWSHGPLGLPGLFRHSFPGLSPWAFESRRFAAEPHMAADALLNVRGP